MLRYFDKDEVLEFFGSIRGRKTVRNLS